jgi:Ran GTPase-activating protein (RanGAP) involved in mRNA processing and transport
MVYLMANFKLDIEILDLSSNDITDRGCEIISNLVMAEHTHLRSLILRDNNKITTKGILDIIACSKENAALRTLEVQFCDIKLKDDDEKESFLKSLEATISLTELKLDGNNLDKDFIEKVENLLDTNREIRKHILKLEEKAPKN